jgi:hypothetical protein
MTVPPAPTRSQAVLMVIVSTVVFSLLLRSDHMPNGNNGDRRNPPIYERMIRLERRFMDFERRSSALEEDLHNRVRAAEERATTADKRAYLAEQKALALEVRVFHLEQRVEQLFKQ